MDGLERMDKPSRWPVAIIVVLLVVAAVGVFFGIRNKAVSNARETTVAVPASPASVLTNASIDPQSRSARPPTLPNAEQGAVLERGEPPAAVAAPAGENESSVATPPPVVKSEVPAVTNIPPAPVPEVAVVTNPPTPIVIPAVTLSEEADVLLAAGAKDKAREKYMAALDAHPDSSLRAKIEHAVGPLNVELARTPWAMAEKQEVVVQEGDSIKAIARKFGTTVELVVKGNELKRPDVIRPGQHLKVFAGKLELKVSKGRHDLLVTANGRFFKRYNVGTGRYEKTPVGTFVVSERIPEPPWWRDDGRTVPFGDKENILGTRWMAIKATGNTKEIKGYGIHGTWDNASIGKSESAGCIRLKNEDVEEIFELVPVGTPVTIEE